MVGARRGPGPSVPCAVRSARYEAPGLPLRPGSQPPSAFGAGLALWGCPLRLQLGAGDGEGAVGGQSCWRGGGGALDAARAEAGVESGQGGGGALVGRELQGSLRLGPGWAGPGRWATSGPLSRATGVVAGSDSPAS